MSEIPGMICFVVAAAALVSASVHDVRTREVPDIHWAVIGVTGMALMIIGISDGVTAERLMICAGSAMILCDILCEREWPPHMNAIFYATAAMMFAIPLMTSFDDPFVTCSAAIPVCYVIFLALFFGGVIKGGADVKCLISLAIMFPSYPAFGTFIARSAVSAVFPFPLAVLLHASVISVLAMIPLIARNIMRGDTRMPNMFVGHRMDADRVGSSHVWPMCENADGDGKIWVTPKIPFIVPITAAVLFVTFVGNIMFLI
ncbi:MAG: hypothetical protein LBI08_00265 [Methanomassiliicoccaceae archaeon]|nr:hypothetical protein [Methanomassiliicoccaceae archaeon]